MPRQMEKVSTIKTTKVRGVDTGTIVAFDMPAPTTSEWLLKGEQAEENFKPRIVRKRAGSTWRERWPNV